MTVTVRYIGTQSPYFETAITGKPGKWTTGDCGDVPDVDAALLVDTGLFEVFADRVLPFVFNAAGAIVAVRDRDGSQKSLPGASGGTAYAEQFDVLHAGLLTTPVYVTADGVPPGFSGPCLVESIMCLTPGTGGPVRIFDAADAADATKLRFSRAVADMVAGTVYPLAGDGAAVLFTTGIYFDNSTSGVYVINAAPEAA